MIRAGERRLRPIMMTALATVAGMIPLALALGAGSQMLQPLAIAVIGGILASMVLSLVVTPAVHYYIGGRTLNCKGVTYDEEDSDVRSAGRRRIQRRRLQGYSTRSRWAARAAGTTSPWTRANAAPLRLARRHRGSGGSRRPARWSGQITQLHGVHGIAVASDLGKGFITNGQSNSVTIFDLKTLAKTGEPAARPESRCHLLRAEDASASSPSTDAATTPRPSTPRPTKSSRPSRSARSRRICAVDGAGKVYVNIENSSEIVEIDAAKPAVTRRASLAPCEGPSGLAIDVKNKKLFRVCSNKMMAVTDIPTMKVIATPAIGSGTDGAGFDPAGWPSARRRRRHVDHRQTGQRQVRGRGHRDHRARRPHHDGRPEDTPRLSAGRRIRSGAGGEGGQEGARPPVLPDSFHVMVIGK